MSHRIYLIRRSAENTDIIAEANNLLPFFWLTLIRQVDLEAKVPEMENIAQLMGDEEAYEQYQDNDIGAANIKIDATAAITNAKSAVHFISLHFPHVAELFTDFIDYLCQRVQPNDVLELDIIAIAGFTDMPTFIQTLREELKDIQQQRPEKISGYFEGDVTYSLTGYAGDFEKRSAGFKKLADVKNQRPKKPYVKRIPLESAQLRSRRIKAGILLLIGIGITIAAVMYMKRNGISLAFSVWVLFGLACVGFAIEKLISKTNDVR
jgi:hypothetical protein